MSLQTPTLDELRAAGLVALLRELGPVGMIRFLQQFETGRGDYSNERHQWLGKDSAPALAERIYQQRKANESS